MAADKTKKRIMRAVSLLTLGFFLVSQVTFANPGVGIEIAVNREMPGFLRIDIPTELASLDGIWEAPPSVNSKVILHIQNAHANYGAQKKIQSLLQYLNKTYAIKTIFVEGAAEDLNPDYLKLFPDKTQNLELADLLAQQGKITGAELYLLETSDATVKGKGIEDAKLYRNNYEALKKVFGAEALVNRYLQGYESRLEALSSKIFTNDLRRVLSDWQKFEKGHREFMPYIRSLAADAKRVLNLDLESLFSQVEWPQITRLLVLQGMEKDLDTTKALEEKDKLINFLKAKGVSPRIIAEVENFKEQRLSVRQGQGDMMRPRDVLETLVKEAGPKGFYFRDYPAFSLYAGYLILKSELDAKGLFEEIKVLFEKILDSLAVGSNQKTLLQLYRDEELARKLLRLELSRRDWQDALRRKTEVQMDSLISRLKDLSMAVTKELKLAPSDLEVKTLSPKFREQVLELYVSAFSFYEFARQRESMFYEKINAVMGEASSSKAILITGGFHTDGMTDLFREHNVSYGVLTPRLMEKSDEKLYRNTMLQNEQQLFSISYLELANGATSLATRRDQGFDPAKELGDLIRAFRSKLSKESATGQGVADAFNNSVAAKAFGITLEFQPAASKASGIDTYKIKGIQKFAGVEVPVARSEAREATSQEIERFFRQNRGKPIAVTDASGGNLGLSLSSSEIQAGLDALAVKAYAGEGVGVAFVEFRLSSKQLLNARFIAEQVREAMRLAETKELTQVPVLIDTNGGETRLTPDEFLTQYNELLARILAGDLFFKASNAYAINRAIQKMNAAYDRLKTSQDPADIAPLESAAKAAEPIRDQLRAGGASAGPHTQYFIAQLTAWITQMLESATAARSKPQPKAKAEAMPAESYWVSAAGLGELMESLSAMSGNVERYAQVLDELSGPQTKFSTATIQAIAFFTQILDVDSITTTEQMDRLFQAAGSLAAAISNRVIEWNKIPKLDGTPQPFPPGTTAMWKRLYSALDYASRKWTGYKPSVAKIMQEHFQDGLPIEKLPLLDYARSETRFTDQELAIVRNALNAASAQPDYSQELRQAAGALSKAMDSMPHPELLQQLDALYGRSPSQYARTEGGMRVPDAFAPIKPILLAIKQRAEQPSVARSETREITGDMTVQEAVDTWMASAAYERANPRGLDGGKNAGVFESGAATLNGLVTRKFVQSNMTIADLAKTVAAALVAGDKGTGLQQDIRGYLEAVKGRIASDLLRRIVLNQESIEINARMKAAAALEKMANESPDPQLIFGRGMIPVGYQVVLDDGNMITADGLNAVLKAAETTDVTFVQGGVSYSAPATSVRRVADALGMKGPLTQEQVAQIWRFVSGRSETRFTDQELAIVRNALNAASAQPDYSQELRQAAGALSKAMDSMPHPELLQQLDALYGRSPSQYARTEGGMRVPDAFAPIKPILLAIKQRAEQPSVARSETRIALSEFAKAIEQRMTATDVEVLKDKTINDVSLDKADTVADVALKIAFVVHGILELNESNPGEAADRMTALALALGANVTAAIKNALPQGHVLPVSNTFARDVRFVSGASYGQFLESVKVMLVLNPKYECNFVMPDADAELARTNTRAFEKWASEEKLATFNISGRVHVMVESEYVAQQARHPKNANTVFSVSGADQKLFSKVRFDALRSAYMFVDLAIDAQPETVSAATATQVKLALKIGSITRFVSSNPVLKAEMIRGLEGFDQKALQNGSFAITNESLRSVVARIWQEFQAVVQVAIAA